MYPKEESLRNYNLDLLKTLCAFLVVVAHFGRDSFLISFATLAVPVFMILSFYFFYDKICSVDIIQRIRRLAVPLVGWAIIYFLIYYFVLKMHDLTISDLLYQSVTGHDAKLNASMWFQNNLIILTLVAFFLFKKFQKHFFIIMLCCCITAYILQYSGVNYHLFANLGSELKYPLGRLTEMVPFMVVGLVLKKYDLLHNFSERLIYLWIVLFICVHALIRIHVPMSFGYAGIKLCMLSVILVFLFNSIPQGNRFYKNILRIITQNTLGIYCIHRLVEKFLHPYIFTEYNTFYCLIIFVVSWIICYGISKIPSKNIQALVK